MLELEANAAGDPENGIRFELAPSALEEIRFHRDIGVEFQNDIGGGWKRGPAGIEGENIPPLAPPRLELSGALDRTWRADDNSPRMINRERLDNLPCPVSRAVVDHYPCVRTDSLTR